jgi:hypothetical protein
MSGPIFIQDAHGTPLMPTAAAHARKLLQQGGQRVPHPTFTIVRLARPVDSPSLRPVLLTVEHQGAHLALSLIVQRLQESLLLLTILLGPMPHLWYRPLPRRRVHQRLRSAPGARRFPPFPRRLVRVSPSRWSLRDISVDDMAEVMLALRQLVPISHLVFPGGPPLTTTEHRLWQLREHPACAGLGLASAAAAAELISSSRDQARPQADTAQPRPPAPIVLAWLSVSERGSRPPSASHQLETGSLAQLPSVSGKPIGVVVGRRAAGRIVLAFPRRKNGTDIHWQRTTVRRDALRMLHSEPTMFLPVAVKPASEERMRHE